MELEFNQRFDYYNMLQYVNNEPSVMHCHHYTTLFIDLAQKTREMDGPRLLQESMEESFYLVLKKYYISKNISDRKEQIEIATEYFAAVGLGKLNITRIHSDGGSAELTHSHVDIGWLKKFGKSEVPLDFITMGYLSAVFELVFNHKLQGYNVTQTESIAKGDRISRFEIVRI